MAGPPGYKRGTWGDGAIASWGWHVNMTAETEAAHYLRAANGNVLRAVLNLTRDGTVYGPRGQVLPHVYLQAAALLEKRLERARPEG